MTEVANASYFKGYQDLRIHNLMLKDKPRTQAYYDAVMKNKMLFEGKVVLDVGAGTGILSLFCAKAGAKKVYAVEAVEKLAELIKKLAVANNFSDVITVVAGQVEELAGAVEGLREGSVDIIVSEWMGFCLLQEGMLGSVIAARDSFLKSDGLIFPDKCLIQLALCKTPEYYNWDNFYNLDLTEFGNELRNTAKTDPQIFYVDKDHLLSEPVDFYSFDTKTVSESEVECVSKVVLAVSTGEEAVEGLCLWFDVSFPGSPEGETVSLSTSPFCPETHWKNTVIVLPAQVPAQVGDPFCFSITLRKLFRKYIFEMEALDGSEVEHPIPCSCNELKCKIIKKYIENQQETTEAIYCVSAGQ